MAKEIILYNLRDDVKEEDYVKWCASYKGPLLLSLPGAKTFTLAKMMGGMTGDGQKGTPPSPAGSPYKYVGIMDIRALKSGARPMRQRRLKRSFSPSGSQHGWLIFMSLAVSRCIMEKRNKTEYRKREQGEVQIVRAMREPSAMESTIIRGSLQSPIV